jgi:phosphotransferase system HPr (HPr) family protein
LLAKIKEDGSQSELVDGASILKVMSLGIKCGESIRVQVEGENETQAAQSLQKIVESSDH